MWVYKSHYHNLIYKNTDVKCKILLAIAYSIL